MNNTAFKTYASENGGRVVILFLLFLLALFEFATAGFGAFAIICALPIVALVAVAAFHYRMFTFWVLISVNYLIQWQLLPKPQGIPLSLYNEGFEIMLLALAILDVKNTKFERCGNVMFLTLLTWAGYCTLELINDTCGVGMDVAAWFQGVRLMSYQLIYAFVIFTLYISDTKILKQYLYVWGALALVSVFWVFKQKYIGLTPSESAWLHGPHGRQHLLQAGTLIRYWSIYSDAANYGIGIASTAVAYIIFGITTKIRKQKIYFFIVGFACFWAIFPTGTRTAIACIMAGFMAYIFLSKSFKIAIPVTVFFALFVFILAFTNIGQGNQQIRRMRSAFDKNDASSGVRKVNQETMKKYMREAPFGIGIGMNYSNVPANNKFNKIATIPPDSEYVFIWLRTGVVGITIFLICTAIMIFGACRIVFFQLKSPSLRGIGAGLCCAMISQQLGGYGNQVLMQFPNCLTFYGGLAIVYILPYLEKEWMEIEREALSIQEEKKRLKLEKKRAKRV